MIVQCAVPQTLVVRHNVHLHLLEPLRRAHLRCLHCRTARGWCQARWRGRRWRRGRRGSTCAWGGWARRRGRRWRLRDGGDDLGCRRHCQRLVLKRSGYIVALHCAKHRRGKANRAGVSSRLARKKTKTTNFGFAMCWRGPASVSLLVVPGMQFRRRRLGKKRNVCIDQDIEPPNLGFAICSAARDWRRVLVSPPVRVHGVSGPEMNR